MEGLLVTCPLAPVAAALQAAPARDAPTLRQSQTVLRTVCVRAQSYPVFVHRPAISPWACLPHPASRRRTCPLPNLRLCEYLVSGLSPDWIRAMHGTHVRKQKSPVHRGFQGCFLDRTGQSKTHLWRSGRQGRNGAKNIKFIRNPNTSLNSLL